jgi:hypothetical protein
MRHWPTYLFIAAFVCISIALGQAIPRSAFVSEVIDTNPPPRMLFAGGVSGNWLTIARVNAKDPTSKGFDPSQTYIVTDFEPKVRKTKEGKWLIQFECSICKDLP